MVDFDKEEDVDLNTIASSLPLLKLDEISFCLGVKGKKTEMYQLDQW